VVVISLFQLLLIHCISTSDMTRSSGSCATGVVRPPSSPSVKIVRVKSTRGPPSKKPKRNMDVSVKIMSCVYEAYCRKDIIHVSERDMTPSDSVDALSDTTLQGELNDLIRRTVEREAASLKTVIKRLQQSRTRLDEQHSAREKHLLTQLDDAQKHIARLQAVPFPLSSMHCNKCGEAFSENEAIHVADDCGAVSRYHRILRKLADIHQSFFARIVERTKHTPVQPTSLLTPKQLIESSKPHVLLNRHHAPALPRPIFMIWVVVG
jgi:hypothetical protein